MEEEQDNEFVPPTLDRVCRRAFVLVSVACRASLEEAPQHPDSIGIYGRLQQWIADEDLRQEFEAHEWEGICCPLGALTRRDRIDMSWRSEGLVVLAWALQRSDLPPHDTQADGPCVGEAIGFLEDGAVGRLIADARERSQEDLRWLEEMTLAVHWRLRQYSLHPEPIDFVDFAQKCQWADMPIADLPMIDRDLALRGKPISQASESLLSECTSIASERQQAANWLAGYEAQYSEVTCDT